MRPLAVSLGSKHEDLTSAKVTPSRSCAVEVALSVGGQACDWTLSALRLGSIVSPHVPLTVRGQLKDRAIAVGPAILGRSIEGYGNGPSWTIIKLHIAPAGQVLTP